jgi:hypothetical protein
MVKKLTGKKVTVIEDELNIKGGGLYAYFPFESLDKKGKGVFKIGMAINFKSRTEQYHTYFPLGVYMIAFLENPPLQRSTRHRKVEETTKKSYYLKIEKFVFDYIDKNGGKRIFSTTRVKNPELETNKGETEFSYTNEQTIHEAFTEAKEKYGGNLKLFYLEGLDAETNKFTSINQIAKEREKDTPNYQGKIIFHT